jgi:hypothetical protein
MKMLKKLLDSHKNVRSGSKVHILRPNRCLIILITEDFIVFKRGAPKASLVLQHGGTHAVMHGAILAATHGAPYGATHAATLRH